MLLNLPSGFLQVRLAMKFRCPNCQHPIEVDANDTTLEASPQAQAGDSITCPTCQSRFSLSSEDSPTHVPDKGMTIAHFEVRQVLGEGSFGTVYKCFDTELKRYVAVKVPREGRVAPDSAKLFMKEARAAAAVNHPNVISVHEVGQHGDGFYIAAEFIDGINLSETIRISPLSIKDATILTVKLLRAAHFFHEKGIVHRDLKSGNILIDAANEPHIADFGLARREGKNEITVTQSGHVIGTPAYMSPEQARGDVRGTGPASDQYSIGVIFYELLTGVRPFPATNSRTVMHRILTEPARNPRSVNKAIPKDLDTICIKALEKDPASRYSSAAEMANDLQRFLDGRPILARPASVAIKLQRWCRRNPGMAALSAVIAVLLVTTGLMAMQRPEPPEAVVRIEAPAAKTHPVRLTYSMNGSNAPANPKARWAIVPLDKLTGLPIEDRIGRFETSAELVTPLEPGRYLIVVEVAGFGFHEVYRRVPDDPASLPSIFAVERWEKPIDGVVPLPTITVWQNGLAESKMVYVAGGDFEMGAGLDDSSPRHRRKVNDFYLDETEVCVADYETIRPARHADDFDTSLLRLPKRSVDWAAAAHVAEAMGKRLPMEDEFEFAATNRGTTTFPWGEEPLAAGITEIQSVDVKTIDVCRDFPIRNMISNVAELTNSVPGAYPGSAAQKVELIADSKGMNRIVRGGWKQQSADEHRAKQRESIFCLASDPNLGFRCARSKRPSY